MSAVLAGRICKSFRSLLKRKPVLHDIDLDIGEDEIFGILGPNGSGKTTLLSIFSTILYPDSGSLQIMGMDARVEQASIRKVINISSGKPNFPWSLTVFENLRHSGMLYGLHGRELASAIEQAMDVLELWPHEGTRFENLSTGIKQRLSLAKSLLNHPQLLFLDEPTTGLDPEIAIKTRSMVRTIHEMQGISVVVTTHYMPEAEELCDRIAFLRSGRIVALDTPSNLKRDLGLGDRIVIRYQGFVDLEALRALPGIMCCKASKGEVEIVFDRNDAGISRIMRLFRDADIMDIKIDEPDLEDVFLELAR